MKQRARSRSAARKRFTRYLQLSLSCLDPSAQWFVAKSAGGLSVGTKDPIRLRGRALDLELEPTMLFSIGPRPGDEKDYKVSTLAYSWHIAIAGAQGAKASKLVYWHWHPSTGSEHCHVHVYGQHAQMADVGKMHITTGRVVFEDVVRFLIEDMGVSPARPDWSTVLEDTTHRVRRWSTWHGPRPIWRRATGA